jgi:hypothetical protein
VSFTTPVRCGSRSAGRLAEWGVPGTGVARSRSPEWSPRWVEVSTDTAVDRAVLRHAARLVRLRPDLNVDDIHPDAVSPTDPATTTGSLVNVVAWVVPVTCRAAWATPAARELRRPGQSGEIGMINSRMKWIVSFFAAMLRPGMCGHSWKDLPV